LYALDAALANPLQVHYRRIWPEIFKNAITAQIIARLCIFLLFIFSQLYLLLLPLFSHSGLGIKQIAERNGIGRAGLLAGSLYVAVMYLAPLGFCIIPGSIGAL